MEFDQVSWCGHGRWSVEVFKIQTRKSVVSVPAIPWDSGRSPKNPFRDDFFAFSPDSKRIAVAGRANSNDYGQIQVTGSDFSVDVWNIKTGNIVHIKHSGLVRSVAWALSGEIATGTDHEVGRKPERELSVYGMPILGRKK